METKAHAKREDEDVAKTVNYYNACNELHELRRKKSLLLMIHNCDLPFYLWPLQKLVTDTRSTNIAFSQVSV